MPQFENAHALVIGIANYQHIKKLSPVVLKDAQDIYNLLADDLLCGYAKDNVELMLDDQATQQAVRQALARLAKRSTPDSTVFIYYSGHGGQALSGPAAGEYLLTTDSVYTMAAVAKTAISGTEFTKALQAISAQKIVVVFDCCHAGGIGETKGADAELKAGLPDRYYEALKAGRGRVILASSRDSEYSHILPNARNSLFTKHLLEGLRGGVASEDGVIRIFELFEYLQPRVTSEEPEQHPIFKSNIEENFPVALYVGGRKGVVPKDAEGYRYDTYISYVDREPDSTWVWQTLKPRLEEAGLRVAVSGDVDEPGVERVVNIERGITQAKRTVIILSQAYLADMSANFENVLAQSMDVQEGTYRLLPIKIAPVDEQQLPRRLSILATLDLTHPNRADREFSRLIKALQGPLPRR